MSEKYVAAIDQGTTSTRCMVFNREGRVVSVDQREHEQIFPRAGWVEHNAIEIWENTRAVAAAALGKVDLTEARAFALDEYVGLPAGHPQSYAEVIRRTVTEPLGLDPARVRAPDGRAEEIEDACADYELAIAEAGGIDIQILGIGANGHIGFNEPSSSLNSPRPAAARMRLSMSLAWIDSVELGDVARTVAASENASAPNEQPLQPRSGQPSTPGS